MSSNNDNTSPNVLSEEQRQIIKNCKQFHANVLKCYRGKMTLKENKTKLLRQRVAIKGHIIHCQLKDVAIPLYIQNKLQDDLMEITSNILKNQLKIDQDMIKFEQKLKDERIKRNLIIDKELVGIWGSMNRTLKFKKAIFESEMEKKKELDEVDKDLKYTLGQDTKLEKLEKILNERNQKQGIYLPKMPKISKLRQELDKLIAEDLEREEIAADLEREEKKDSEDSDQDINLNENKKKRKEKNKKKIRNINFIDIEKIILSDDSDNQNDNNLDIDTEDGSDQELDKDSKSKPRLNLKSKSKFNFKGVQQKRVRKKKNLKSRHINPDSYSPGAEKKGRFKKPFIKDKEAFSDQTNRASAAIAYQSTAVFPLKRLTTKERVHRLYTAAHKKELKEFLIRTYENIVGNNQICEQLNNYDKDCHPFQAGTGQAATAEKVVRIQGFGTYKEAYQGDNKVRNAFIDDKVIKDYKERTNGSLQFRLKSNPNFLLKLFFGDGNIICRGNIAILPAVLEFYFTDNQYNFKTFFMIEVKTDQKFGYFSNNSNYGKKFTHL